MILAEIGAQMKSDWTHVYINYIPWQRNVVDI
jgi:hypothetical protein